MPAVPTMRLPTPSIDAHDGCEGHRSRADTGVSAYEPNLYIKHVPSIDIGAEPGKSVKRQLFTIAAWGVVAWAGWSLRN